MDMYFLAAAQTVASDAPTGPEWYEIASGVLAIPVPLIGIVYSRSLLTKTNLESRKTELEIREKELALAQASPETRAAVAEVLRPLAESQRTETLVMRFILLYIALVAWNAVSQVLHALTTGVYIGLQVMNVTQDSAPWIIYPVALVDQYLPTIGTIVLVVGLGVPLLREVNRVLGVDLRLRPTLPRLGRPEAE